MSATFLSATLLLRDIIVRDIFIATFSARHFCRDIFDANPLNNSVTACEEFDQLVIDAAIGQWRARLEACVEPECGHFEHTLLSSII